MFIGNNEAKKKVKINFEKVDYIQTNNYTVEAK